MSGKTLWKIVFLLILLGIAGLLLINIQAVDRLHRSNMQLLAELKARPELPVPPPETLRYREAPEIPDTAEIANFRHFDPGRVPGDRMIQVITSDIPLLNPVLATDASASSMIGLCLPSLAAAAWDNPRELLPDLAESWQISDDLKVFDLKLRRGIVWQSYTDPETGKAVPGRPVTAHDFKFMVDVIKNELVNCSHLRSYYLDLQEVRVLDDLNFQVIWKHTGYGNFSATLALTPLPEHFYTPGGKFDPEKFNTDHRRNQMILSCGPYKLKRYDKGRRLIFERNPDYFGSRLGAGPALEYRVFEIISHPNTAFQALLGGETDQVMLTAEQYEKAQHLPEFKSGKLRLDRYLLPQYTYIGYNQKKPLFREKALRQALTHLVDRERIIRDLHLGHARIASVPFFPLSDLPGIRDIKALPYDPVRAAELLDSINWRDTDGDGFRDRNGEKLEFTILQVSGNSFQRRLMPLLKESFKSCGIDLHIKTVEWSAYLQLLDERNFDACCLGWSSSFDPDMYQIWHSSQIASGSNHISYANAELDNILETLRRTLDAEKRNELNLKAAQILHEDQPYTFLVWPYSLVASSSRYRNLKVHPSGMAILPAWTPEPEQKTLPE